jgi:hypothetical protein
MSMGKNVLVLDGQGELGDTPKPIRVIRGGLIADADQLSASSW